MIKENKGFTLIELLVAIAIIGVLVTISTFAINQAQQSARNNRRKADLETIRSGLEMYRSDCGQYPAEVDKRVPSPLVGSGDTQACSASNTYLKEVPTDPQSSSGRYYRYVRITPTSYALCANQEGLSGVSPVDCGGHIYCGGYSYPCYYKVESP